MRSKLIEKKPCPQCRGEGRDNHGDNLAVYDDGHSFCFRCNHYIGSKTQDTACTYEYLPWRGVTNESFRVYGALTKVDPEGRPISIGYRYPSGNTQVRLLDSKDFYWVVPDKTIPVTGLFGRDKFAAGSHDSIVVTEGALDAISAYQALGTRVPCVSVQSSSSAVADCTRDRDYLNQFQRIYLAFDGDSAGRSAVAAVARLFDYERVFDVRLSVRKDANEFLEHGEGKDFYNIWVNARRYLPESLTSSFVDFDKILNEEPKWGAPYPWKTLNDMTYGIRRGESVLITAQEGVGKTEIMHAIEYKLLTETSSNVGAIFLEELPQRHLQAIAGIHLRSPVHLPDSGYTKDQVRAAIRSVVQTDERLHLHLHFGGSDPDDLLDTIRFLVTARGCDYVLLDHISLVASGLSESDERRFIDRFTTKMEIMVKQLNFALILVSHVNDYGQTRGSRYIGKISDTRIDATRDVTSTDPVVRNTTHLMVSKNRYGMRTGPAGDLLFDPLTYTLMEAANDNHLSGSSGEAWAPGLSNNSSNPERDKVAA